MNWRIHILKSPEGQLIHVYLVWLCIQGYVLKLDGLGSEMQLFIIYIYAFNMHFIQSNLKKELQKQIC